MIGSYMLSFTLSGEPGRGAFVRVNLSGSPFQHAFGKDESLAQACGAIADRLNVRFGAHRYANAPRATAAGDTFTIHGPDGDRADWRPRIEVTATPPLAVCTGAAVQLHASVEADAALTQEAA